MSDNIKNNSNLHNNIERLVRLYAETLYSYALMRVGKQELAEDMVQETLLAALQSWESFTGASSERTWLIGILRHKILDYFRRYHNDSIEEAEDQSWRTEYFDKSRHWKDQISNWNEDPVILAENHEFLRILNDCLIKLSKMMAEAFVMRELEGITPENICKYLGISETNLWVRLHRARLQLRRCLELNWFKR
jgi:RNA polymerase sigma-70 factor (ECF subfamily)